MHHHQMAIQQHPEPVYIPDVGQNNSTSHYTPTPSTPHPLAIPPSLLSYRFLDSPPHLEDSQAIKTNLIPPLQSRKYDAWRDIYSQGKFEASPKAGETSNFPPNKVNRQSEPDYDYGLREKDDENIEAYVYEDENAGDDDNDKKDTEKRPHTDDRMDLPNRKQQGGYGDPSYQQQQGGYGHSSSSSSTEQTSLSRRVLGGAPLALAVIVGIPLALAAVYWLVVVNGPTPVVKARLLAGQEDLGEMMVAVVGDLRRLLARM